MCVPTWAAGLLTGIPGIAEKVLDYAAKRADTQVAIHTADTNAATTLGVEQLRSEVAARNIIGTIASQHEKLVSWIGAAFALHVWAFVLDSVFHLGWHVGNLPGFLGEYEGKFLLMLIGGGAVTSLGKAILSKVWK